MLLLTLHVALSTLCFLYKSPTILPQIENLLSFEKSWEASLSLAVAMSKDTSISEILNATEWRKLKDVAEYDDRDDSPLILFSVLEGVLGIPQVEAKIREHPKYLQALFASKALAISITDDFRLLDMSTENWKGLQAITRAEIIPNYHPNPDIEVVKQCTEICENPETCRQKDDTEAKNVELSSKVLKLTNTNDNELRNLFWNLVPTNTDSAMGFLQMGYLLNLPFLANRSTKYLEQDLTMENAVKLYQLAINTEMKELKRKAEEFILLEFEDISKDDRNFPCLKLGELLPLLTSEKLKVPNEKTVFDAIARWVRHDEASRQVHVSLLMKSVKLHLFPLSVLNLLLDHHLLVDLKPIQQSIRSAITLFHTNSTRLPSLIKQEHRNLHESLFVIGGTTPGNPNVTVETYSITKKEWIYQERHNNGTTGKMSVLPVNQTIYVFAHDKFDLSAFDPIRKAWKYLSAIPNNRRYFSHTELSGRIYVLGGQTNAATTICQFYDIGTGEWTTLPNMNLARNFAAAATLQGKVYIVGGHTGAKVVNSVEVFDEETNRWHYAAPMITPRHVFSLVAEGNNLWAFGGHNGAGALNAVERYDTYTKTWIAILPVIPTTRYYHSVAYFSGNFFIIGDVSNTPRVDVYNPRRKVWTRVVDLNFGRQFFGACVVNNLPNAMDYLTHEKMF